MLRRGSKILAVVYGEGSGWRRRGHGATRGRHLQGKNDTLLQCDWVEDLRAFTRATIP